jgi:hypothetical protein
MRVLSTVLNLMSTEDCDPDREWDIRPNIASMSDKDASQQVPTSYEQGRALFRACLALKSICFALPLHFIDD